MQCPVPFLASARLFSHSPHPSPPLSLSLLPKRYSNLLSDSGRILDFSRATTRSCESTSRRESTAHPPSYATIRPPSRLRSPLHSFSSRRFISSKGGRAISGGRRLGSRGRNGAGGAHKSPRARNRKHPRDGPLLLPPLLIRRFPRSSSSASRFFVFFEGRARFRLLLPAAARPLVLLLVLCPAFLA